MWWVLIWVLLLMAAGAYLAARAWGLWGQLKELGSELAVAQSRLDEVQGQLDALGEGIDSAQELAVFADPATARHQRDLASAAGRLARRQRRTARRPSRGPNK